MFLFPNSNICVSFGSILTDVLHMGHIFLPLWLDSRYGKFLFGSWIFFFLHFFKYPQASFWSPIKLHGNSSIFLGFDFKLFLKGWTKGTSNLKLIIPHYWGKAILNALPNALWIMKCCSSWLVGTGTISNTL